MCCASIGIFFLVGFVVFSLLSFRFDQFDCRVVAVITLSMFLCSVGSFASMIIPLYQPDFI